MRRLVLAVRFALQGPMRKAFIGAEDGAAVFAIQAGPFIYYAWNRPSSRLSGMMEGKLPGGSLMPSQAGFTELALKYFRKRPEPVWRFRYSAAGIASERLERFAGGSRYLAEVVELEFSVLGR